MKKTLNDLKEIYENEKVNLRQREIKKGFTFKVFMGEEAISNGARDILYEVIKKDNEILSDVLITKNEEDTEYLQPAVEVIDNKNIRYIYAEVDIEKAIRIFLEHAVGKKIVKDLLTKEITEED